MPDVLSVYRALSDVGIGEGIGTAAGHGIQYLASGSPLESDLAFLEAARIWMTLDDNNDWIGGGPDFETWSVAEVREYLLVVRLARFGHYGGENRVNFFAHGRAVPLAQVAGAFDPGAWIGQAEAFDPPWLTTPSPRPPIEPWPTRPDQVMAESALAVELLAATYEAMRLRVPLIWRVPLADFRTGGPIAALLSFVRSALPLSLRRLCAIRMSAALPEPYFRAGATVLVLSDVSPLSFQLSMRERPDAIAMDRSGQRIAGAAPSEDVRRYAGLVMKRFARYPEALLAFGTRYHELAGTRELAVGSLSSLAPLYNVQGLMQRGRADVAFRHVIEFLESDKVSAISPTSYLNDAEWAAISLDALLPLILDPSPKPEVQALAERVRLEIRHRGVTLDEALEKEWAPTFGPGKLPLLAQMSRQGLVSRALSQELVARQTAADLAALDASDLEALAPAIDWTRLVLDESSATDLALKGLFTSVLEVTGTRVTEGWLRAFEARSAAAPMASAWPSLVSAIDRLPAAGDSLTSIARTLLQVARLGDEWRLALSGTRSQALQQLPELLLAVEELKSRANGTGRSAYIDSLMRADSQWLAGFPSPLRRAWIARFADASWGSLDAALVVSPAGELRVPESWIADVAPTIWGHDEMRARLSAGLAARIHAASAATPDFASLLIELDRRLDSRPEAIGDWIDRVRFWEWREQSRLPMAKTRDVARAWMRLDRWKLAGTFPALEDWKAAMCGDDRWLDATLAEKLVTTSPAPLGIPFAPRADRNQLDDVCLALTDARALASLADALQARLERSLPETFADLCPTVVRLRVDVRRMLLETCQRKNRFAMLTTEALAVLGKGRAGVLPLADVQGLAEEIGWDAPETIGAVNQSVVKWLFDEPDDAVDLATRARLLDGISRDSQAVLDEIHRLLVRKAHDPRLLVVARALESVFAVAMPQTPPRHLPHSDLPAAKALARSLAFEFPSVAHFIHREAAKEHKAKGHFDILLAAAVNGSAASPAWDQLRQQYAAYIDSLNGGEAKSPNPCDAFLRAVETAVTGKAGGDSGDRSHLRWLESLLSRASVLICAPQNSYRSGIPILRLAILSSPRVPSVRCALWLVEWMIEGAKAEPLLLEWMRSTTWWMNLTYELRTAPGRAERSRGDEDPEFAAFVLGELLASLDDPRVTTAAHGALDRMASTAAVSGQR